MKTLQAATTTPYFPATFIYVFIYLWVGQNHDLEIHGIYGKVSRENNLGI